MRAIDDFAALIGTTEVMRQLLKNLREEPAYLLRDICREYERTGQLVPDHHLNPTGYSGEASLKALVSAGLLSRQTGDRFFLYAYEPTPAGLEQYERLKADGFYQRK